MPPWPYWAEQGQCPWVCGGERDKRSKRGEQGLDGDQHQGQDLDPMGHTANDV